MTPEALERLAQALTDARAKETFVAYHQGEDAARYMSGVAEGLRRALEICRQEPLT